MGHGRVKGDLLEQEVAAGPLILFRELRAGFEQIVGRGVGVLQEQSAGGAFLCFAKDAAVEKGSAYR